MRGGKPGKVARQRAALQRLENAYEAFKSAGVDKASWTTTRNGGRRVINHSGKTFEEECSRMKKEIDILKEKLVLSLYLTFFKS